MILDLINIAMHERRRWTSAALPIDARWVAGSALHAEGAERIVPTATPSPSAPRI